VGYHKQDEPAKKLGKTLSKKRPIGIACGIRNQAAVSKLMKNLV
jgi:hypothetical protein